MRELIERLEERTETIWPGSFYRLDLVAEDEVEAVEFWLMNHKDLKVLVSRAKKKLIKSLVKSAEHNFVTDSSFAKKVQAESDKGGDGYRDHLKASMRRWLAADLKKMRAVSKVLPASFGMGAELPGVLGDLKR